VQSVIRQAIKIVSLKVRNIDNAFREYFLYKKSCFAIRIIISNSLPIIFYR